MSVTVMLLPGRERRVVEVGKAADGFALLKGLGLNPENVIIIRDDRPIPVDSRIRPGDDLRIVRVVSGG